MKKILVSLSYLLACNMGFAQQTSELEEQVKRLQKLKVSGYIQAQFQHGQEDASLKVGAANANKDESFNRFGIRRGRIKFSYEEGVATGVFQLDITEKGVGVKDAYLNIKDPWLRTSSLQAGVFNRPFGYEISYSSSQRESPERSLVFQTLFPDERDLGVSITLQPSKSSPWNFLKLQAGLFAGNGIKQETDNRKDFIGHLSANKEVNSHISWGVGISYYNGGVYQGTEQVYRTSGKGFVLNSETSNKGKFAKREYYGFDGQFTAITALGMTQVKAEYLFGTQPGMKLGSKSPNASTLPTADTYLRQFSGGYTMLVQDLGTAPLSAVVKYDWYDPNTKVSKHDIGLQGTGQGDIAYRTLGMGLLWRASSSIRLQAYYERISNETTDYVPGFEKELSDDVFTLRLQYRF